MNTRLLILLCIVLSPAQGSAKWIEVESENFEFIGEVDEEDARRIVTDLETYRRTILELAGVRSLPEVRKVHVYGMRKISGVRELTGLKGIAGSYTLGNDYPVFVGIAGWTGERARPVMLHEYAHHVLQAHTTEYFPRWYNEGLAEYLSSFEVEDDIITIGKPASQFGSALDAPRWLDIDTVLNSITAYPFERDGSWVEGYRATLFYGMSWLAVHYLQNTPELNQGFGDYIAELNQGMDPAKAFEAGFGITQEDFGDRLHRYWRQDRFPVVQFRITEAFEILPMTIREITKAEAEIALAEPRALFVSADADKSRERDDVRRELQELMEEYGPSPPLYNASMIVELRDGNYDGAVAIGEKALALAPENPLAIQTLADALYHRYLADGTKYKSDLGKARTLFGKQLDLDPTNPTANNHYPVTFIFDGTPPDEQAIEAVAFNVRYKRSPINFDSYLESAEVLLMAGLVDSSCLLLSRVDRWIRASDGKLAGEQQEETYQQGRETRLERLVRLKGMFGGECNAGS